VQAVGRDYIGDLLHASTLGLSTHTCSPGLTPSTSVCKSATRESMKITHWEHWPWRHYRAQRALFWRPPAQARCFGSGPRDRGCSTCGAVSHVDVRASTRCAVKYDAWLQRQTQRGRTLGLRNFLRVEHDLARPEASSETAM